MLENNSSHAFFHLNHFPVMKTYCFLGIPPLINFGGEPLTKDLMICNSNIKKYEKGFCHRVISLYFRT